MYSPLRSQRAAPLFGEAHLDLDPLRHALIALQRVRKARTHFVPGIPFDAERLRPALSQPFPDQNQEMDRLFSLGWLAWLDGNLAEAEDLFYRSSIGARAVKDLTALTESAFWLARVRLALGRDGALSEFESVLKTLGGSPQATAWYVDLLWRSGRTERAEQVWKSVRGNRKVISCEEGPILEARSFLQGNNSAAAERVLSEAKPSGAVVQAERTLLLAWIAAERKDPDLAADWLRKADEAPYPRAPLQKWRRWIEARLRGEERTLLAEPKLLALLRHWADPQLSPGGSEEGQLWALTLPFLAALERNEPIQDPQLLELTLYRDKGNRLRQVASSVLLVEAARRGDLKAVTILLEKLEGWRGPLSAPPRFVTDALAHLAARFPNESLWRKSLPGWLRQWGTAYSENEGAALATLAGLAEGSDVPPPGVALAAWLLHQASHAVEHDQPRKALAFIRRALSLEPSLADVPVVGEALPELEKRESAAALAATLGASVKPVSSLLLVDAVKQLETCDGGAAILEACRQGERDAALAAVDTLLELPDLTPRLAHHFALLQLRLAIDLEERAGTLAAEPAWRRSWRAWLRVGPSAQPVLDWLLAQHRNRLRELLARGEVEAARRHWLIVHDLPTLAEFLTERVGQFREQLASEYLAATREAMRLGTIAEGMRADYEKGLGFLRRLLSLDRTNLRLLTALVEICNEWFFDLYTLGTFHYLAEQVERFTPFALQLARLIENVPGEVTARAALSDFCKIRGFVATDPEQQVRLYHEALRFNPGNENVRRLLADLGRKDESQT